MDASASTSAAAAAEASTSTVPPLAELVTRGAKRARALYGRDMGVDDGLERA